MARDFEIDTSQFDRLAVDLSNAPAHIAGDVVKALEVNATHIKDSWRDKTRGSESAPLVPLSIDYERKGVVTSIASEIEFEIGARKGIKKQGGVALLYEFGAPAKGLAPRGFGGASLHENEKDLQGGIRKAVDDGLKRAGL